MKRTILLVSFGTTYSDARKCSLDCIAADVAACVGLETEVRQAYTSGMILQSLCREGVEIPTVEEALQQLLAEHTTHLVVVPTHMIPGIEYTKMRDVVEQYRSRFQQVLITTTLLEKPEDCVALVPVLQEMLAFSPEVEYILMGHGTEAEANVRYEQMQQALFAAGWNNVHIASVEAKPDLEDVMNTLPLPEKWGNREILVQPFLVVAGDHARNDMAGSENSYVTKLQAAGYRVKAVVKGLGEYPRFRQLYVEKVRRILSK
jgi:sirohydrochlorin cobaltochelatase